MKSHILARICLAAALCLPALAPSSAAEVKVLTAGAFKQVVLALVPDFETQTGNKVVVDNDTAGGLQKRIESGEAFDVAIITPAIVDGLAASGKIVPNSRVNLATVSIGVVVKEGAPKPDISTVEAFKNALLAAKSVAYIDPASGGSSGIYVDKLLERLGIADQVRPKAKLKKGGYVADLIVSGEAELGVHQISEIVPVKGAVLVGPLPKEIQNTTTYAAGLSAAAQNKDAAQALIKTFSGPLPRQRVQSQRHGARELRDHAFGRRCATARSPRRHYRAGHRANPGLGNIVLFSRRFCRTDRQRDRLVAWICGRRHVDRPAHRRPDLAAGWPHHRCPRRTTSIAGEFAVLRRRSRACWSCLMLCRSICSPGCSLVWEWAPDFMTRSSPRSAACTAAKHADRSPA